MSVRTSQFSRFRDGKIVEMHAVLDSYDMVEQTLGRPFDLTPDLAPDRPETVPVDRPFAHA